MGLRAFVTVGTTTFDPLVQVIDTSECIQALKEKVTMIKTQTYIERENIHFDVSLSLNQSSLIFMEREKKREREREREKALIQLTEICQITCNILIHCLETAGFRSLSGSDRTQRLRAEITRGTHTDPNPNSIPLIINPTLIPLDE